MPFHKEYLLSLLSQQSSRTDLANSKVSAEMYTPKLAENLRILNIKTTEGVNTEILGNSARNTVLSEKKGKSAIIFIIDAANKIVSKTDKFILQSISEPNTEKVQVTETFAEDDPTIYFFGKRTPSYTFMGRLLNSSSIDTDEAEKGEWTKAFKSYWDSTLRGSKLLQPAVNKSFTAPYIAMLVVEDVFYKGYPMNLVINKNSVDDFSAAFSMSWIVLQHDVLINKDKLMEFFTGEASLNKIAADLEKLGQLKRLSNILVSIKNTIDIKMNSNNVQTCRINITLFSDSFYNDPYSSQVNYFPLIVAKNWFDPVKESLSKKIDENDKFDLSFLLNLAGGKSVEISMVINSKKPTTGAAYYKQLIQKINYVDQAYTKQYNLLINKLGGL